MASQFQTKNQHSSIPTLTNQDSQNPRSKLAVSKRMYVTIYIQICSHPIQNEAVQITTSKARQIPNSVYAEYAPPGPSHRNPIMGIMQRGSVPGIERLMS